VVHEDNTLRKKGEKGVHDCLNHHHSTRDCETAVTVDTLDDGSQGPSLTKQILL
jgi:hypothetical protein